jgi:hypothetical protein
MSETEHPLFSSNLRMLCAGLAAVGDYLSARDVAERLLAIEPNFNLDTYEGVRMPFKPESLRRRFIANLRSAGLDG